MANAESSTERRKKKQQRITPSTQQMVWEKTEKKGEQNCKQDRRELPVSAGQTTDLYVQHITRLDEIQKRFSMLLIRFLSTVVLIYKWLYNASLNYGLDICCW